MDKEQLKSLSKTTFFENNEGLISPDGHRKFNDAMIEAVAMDTDLAKQTQRIDALANMPGASHTSTTVVDEVVKNGFASWCRSNGHVIYRPDHMGAIYMPIGEIRYHYRIIGGMIERHHEKTKYFGPAVRVTGDGAYFEVVVAGQYQLILKRKSGYVVTPIVVTEAQASAGYKIQFNDEMTGASSAGFSAKEGRTFARLYYTSQPDYQKTKYLFPACKAYKYTTDYANQTSDGVVMGIAVKSIATHHPVLSRQGYLIDESATARQTLALRQAFRMPMDRPITVRTFVEQFNFLNPEGFTVKFKKSKTWATDRKGKRRTHHIVGYTKVNNRTVTQLRRLRSKLTTADPLGYLPYFIDFRIVQNNAERTVIAQYRGSEIVNRSGAGDQIPGLFVRRI